MNPVTENNVADFQTLDPDAILDLVETAYGLPLTGLCRPYTSYINRVYELQARSGESIVAKFYRPGRWDRAALQEEHDFLLELKAAEIDVVAPLAFQNGETLASNNGMYFAVFPKRGGRNVCEFMEQDWIEIGRILGRVHMIGSERVANHRVTWRPAAVTRDQVSFILDEELIPKTMSAEYRAVTEELIELAEPLFNNADVIRIHGDFHFANLISRPDASFVMIDFDDMAMGPSVQDLWMLLPGYRSEVQREINLFAQGYETFRAFPDADLRLIEILRAMRYIHFCAWCGHQVRDGRFIQNNPNWGTAGYWREEIGDLQKQLGEIRTELDQCAYP